MTSVVEEAPSAPAVTPKFTAERTLEQLRPSELVLDPQINRTVDLKWVEKLKDTFNPLVLGAFIGWRHPDGSIHIVDGQHRWHACHELAYDEPVAVWVYAGLTVETANDLFLLANNQRNVHAIDKFLRAKAAGHPVETGIATVLEEYGFLVGHADDEVGAPSAFISLWKQGGEGLLRNVLEAFTRAFPNDGVLAISAATVTAIAKVERRFRNTETPVDFDVLKEALSDTTLIDLHNERDVLGKTDPSKSKTWHMAAVLVKHYNASASRSKKLPAWGQVA